MKNLFLSLAFVLIGSIRFANNYSNYTYHEVEKIEGTCTYTITTTVTYSNGYSYTYDTTYTTEANSLADCMEKARNHVKFLSAIS